VVVPVPGLNRAVVQAVQFGRSISDDVQAVQVTDDVAAAEKVRERFERQLPGVPFVIVESPFRSLVRPFVTYLDVTTRAALVGAVALQPDSARAPPGAARATQHRRCQHPIPA
jgi:hypothetical protein